MSEICLVPQLYNARRFGVDVEKEYPKLVKVEEECLKMKCFVEAGPDNMPDAQPPATATATAKEKEKEKEKRGAEGGEKEGKKLKT